MSEPRIRVLVADDHAVVREGLRAVLEAADGIEVVAEAVSGPEAVERVEECEPDLVLLDVSMPGGSGLDAAREIADRFPGTGILVLSVHSHPEYVLEAVRAGAHGYLLKHSPPAEIRSAIEAVHAGEEVFAPEARRQLGEALRNEAEAERRASRLRALTPREREVLVRVARGRTSREIAEELGISPRTVETHRESLTRKLRIRSVAGLTRFVLEAGLD